MYRGIGEGRGTPVGESWKMPFFHVTSNINDLGGNMGFEGVTFLK